MCFLPTKQAGGIHPNHLENTIWSSPVLKPVPSSRLEISERKKSSRGHLSIWILIVSKHMHVFLYATLTQGDPQVMGHELISKGSSRKL